MAAGELVRFHSGGDQPFRSRWIEETPKLCVFELIYFARPDSNLNRANVYSFRKELGRALAREHPVNADLVVPVLDSGNTAALGYAEESEIPYEQAMIRNHYVRRTFIEPAQSIRHFGVKVKHNAVQGVLAGKRVTMLRSGGAREVHVRVSSPPTIGPCHYGIDTPTREELIAASHSVEEIRNIIGSDTLGYLSLEAMRRTAQSLKHGFCDACFSDEYQVAVEDQQTTPQLSLFREVEEEQ